MQRTSMPCYASIQPTSSNTKRQGCSISVNHIACSSLWDYPEGISGHPCEFTFHKGKGKENMIHATWQSWHCQTQPAGGILHRLLCACETLFFSSAEIHTQQYERNLSLFFPGWYLLWALHFPSSYTEPFRLEKTFKIIEPNCNARYKDF